MHRRSFLEMLAATPLFSFLPKPKFESEYGLGEYVCHYVEFVNDVMPYGDDNYHSSSFPLEYTLTIEFKNGRECHIAFNVKKDIVKSINKMSEQELMSHYKKDDHTDTWITNFQFGKHKFTLRQVDWTGPRIEITGRK